MAKTTNPPSNRSNPSPAGNGLALKPIKPQVARPGHEIRIPVKAATKVDKLLFELKGASNGAAIDEATGRFRWTPGRRAAGIVPFTVLATDSDGRSASLTFEVNVLNNASPTITPIDDQTIAVGSPFSYQVEATDPDGDPLSYALLSGGEELMISAAGLITGTPASPGTISVEVEVSDSQGGFATASFDLTVTNEPPTITSIADQTVVVGSPFSLQVQASDPEGQELSYELINGSGELGISAGGLITGTPTWPGTITVEVQVTDPHGEFARESFDLTVTNQPPTITPIADQNIAIGSPFSLQVQASDPDGHELTYNLINGPGELAISAGGLITGTLSSPGTSTVEVEVTDPYGAFARESFDLTVTNQPPTITPIPDQSIPVGTPFSLQVQASDPDGHELSYELINGGDDLTISAGGLITGTPASPGTITVEVEVTDAYGAYARESFDLTVTNQPPTITPIPDQTIPVGQAYYYQVQATDPEGQELTYELINGGQFLFIGMGGYLTGTPSSTGTFAVEVQVTDPHGAYARESFDLTVV